MHGKAVAEHKELPPNLANKGPLVTGQKSPQLVAVALVPTPKQQQRKEPIKPQSAEVSNQKKRIDLKPLPKKE